MLLLVAVAAACDRAAAEPGAEAPPISADEQAAARASYDRYRRPDLLVAALGLEAGDVVADVGAGNGYLEPYLAAAVEAKGRIVATDVDPAALAELRRRTGASSTTIETRLVTPEDPGLEAETYDLVLMVQVDHLLLDRAAYFRRLVPALKAGGRIAISNRLTYKARAAAAAEEAGLAIASESTELPGQFLLIFEVTP